MLGGRFAASHTPSFVAVPAAVVSWSREPHPFLCGCSCSCGQLVPRDTPLPLWLFLQLWSASPASHTPSFVAVPAAVVSWSREPHPFLCGCSCSCGQLVPRATPLPLWLFLQLWSAGPARHNPSFVAVPAAVVSWSREPHPFLCGCSCSCGQLVLQRPLVLQLGNKNCSPFTLSR